MKDGFHNKGKHTMADVRIYTTTYCPYCVAAKSLLDQKGVEYEEINLSGDYEERMKIAHELGWRTVPIILIGDEVIGGFMELRSLDSEQKLDELLS